MKSILKQLLPPILVNSINKLRVAIEDRNKKPARPVEEKKPEHKPKEQSLDMYWDPEYAKVLETWGLDNVWNEIQMFLVNCEGKVLDVACGTGITIEILSKFPKLEIHGFDISDLLIEKAIEKNIPQDRLKVCDATKTDYENEEFDYSFSIGSLEHFTDEGIDQFIAENARYTKKTSIHMMPVSRSKTDEGWMTTVQSFFNNSEGWWIKKFKKEYAKVDVIHSKWDDDWSYGCWFICQK